MINRIERIRTAARNTMAKQERPGAWLITADRAAKLGLPMQEALDLRNERAKAAKLGRFNVPFTLQR